LNRTSETRNTFISQLGPLLILTSIFFVNFLSRIILSPMLPAVEMDMNIDHGTAGSFFLIISIGYFTSLLSSGFIASRITHRSIIILSTTALGISLFFIAACNSLTGIRLGFVVLGLATGFYLPSGIATLTAITRPENWGKTIAVHEIAPNLAFVLAPLSAEALMMFLSWRGVLIFMGIIALLIGLLFMKFAKGGDFHGDAPGFGSLRSILSNPVFWIMMILFGMGVSSTLGIFAILPLYLVTEHHITRNWANTLISFSRLSGIGMAFFGGWVTDRFGARITLCGVFVLTGAITILLGIAQVPWLYGLVFLQPMLAVCFFPAGFVALSNISSSGTRNLAVSLTVPLGFVIGGGAIPMIIGIMGDTGSFSSGIVFTGAFIFSGALISYFLKRIKNKST